MSGPFDVVLGQHTAVLERNNGTFARLPVHRWRAEPDTVDALILDRCTGSTLDIGCGPGRLTKALSLRGVSTLGIDTSEEAVRMTRRRGGRAMLLDVFDAVPDEGCWKHVLLVDGNVGIGGDPAVLFERVHSLLRPGGSVLIEVGRPGTGIRVGPARLDGGSWFPWAELDLDTAVSLGSRMEFTISWAHHGVHRWFVELGRV